MRKIILGLCAMLVLVTLPAFAEDAVVDLIEDAAIESAEAPAMTAVEIAPEPDVQWIGELDVRELGNGCCRDLCKNDRQCERLYGPGAVCLPDGPCGCRECFATM